MNKSVGRPFLSFAFLVQFAFWTVSLGFILYLSSLNLGTEAGIQRALLVFICHLVNFYCCYSFLVPRYYEKKRFVQAFTGLFLLLLLLTPARYYVEKQFIGLSTAVNTQFLTRRGMIGFIVFSELAIAAIASLLRLAVSNEERKSKITELEKLQLETELRFLKAQMNPHFLFNTINNIYSLVLIKSDKAPEALMKLSGLLRYLLYESHGKVELAKETEAIRAFIELYQLRSEEKPNIQFTNEVHKNGIFIEPLLLMPLLENAVKHSGIGIEPDAVVKIEITEENNRLITKVSNSKARSSFEKEAGGIGLANIQKRLQLMYPSKHQLTIEEDKNNFQVLLMIPLL